MLLIFGSTVVHAQTTLTKGDIAIVGYATDSTDGTWIVNLVPVAANTQITLSQSASQANGTFSTSEDSDNLTYTFLSATAAGTIISIPWSNLSDNGDQIFLYQGTRSQANLIYAISSSVWITSGSTTSNTSYAPNGLIAGTTYPSFASEVDNGYVTSLTGSRTKSEWLTYISTAGNWTRAASRPTDATFPSGTIVVASTGLTPPTVAAAVGATVDAPFSVTFNEDASWRGAITGVTFGGTPLTAGYSVSAGMITFTPSASVPANLLQSSGSKAIVVSATGYADATVNQSIGSGAATKLGVTTQPTAPVTNGSALVVQPAVSIQDQYGNTTASTTTVTATVGAGAWTLGGISSVNAVSGTATFSGLTATSAVAVTSATIDFTSPGLTGATSDTFNIPTPPQANDDPSGAIVLTPNTAAVGGTFAGSTPFLSSTRNDVWYQFTAVGPTATVTIDTFSVAADKDLYVYSVQPVSYSTSVNVIASGVGTSLSSETATANNFVSGTTYYILVQDYNNNGGSFNISVSNPVPPPTPQITGTATATEFTTTYGTASAAQTFPVTGSNLTANIIATAPTGFEVSFDGSTFASTATLTQGDGSASGTLSIRIAATALATGSYDAANISLASTGATTRNIITAASGNMVSPLSVTVTGAAVTSKPYDGSTTATITGATVEGAVNGDVLTVTSGAFIDANAGTEKAVTLILSGTSATSYSLIQPAGLTGDITQADQTITFGALAPKASTAAPFTLTATASSGLAVSYTSSDSAVATVDGSTVTVVGVGTTTITASQLGDGNYTAAPAVPQTLVVLPPPLATFEFPASNSLAVTSKQADVTVSNVTLSSGTIDENQTTGDYFPNEPYIAESGGWTATAQSSAKSFNFTVTAATGYTFSITNVSFRAYATGAGPSAFGFGINTANVYAVNAPDGEIVEINQNVTEQSGLSAATIKIQGWLNGSRSSSGGGVFRLDDIVITGTVTPNPPTVLDPEDITLTRDGNSFSATSPGVSGFSYSYVGTNYAASATAPTAPGFYTITATSADPNYTGGRSEDYFIAGLLAANDSVTRQANSGGFKIPVASLFGNDGVITEAGAFEQGGLSITGVASGTGNTVTVSGAFVFYTPTDPGSGDPLSFTYTLSDGTSTATGTVTVTTVAATAFTLDLIRVVTPAAYNAGENETSVMIEFAGVPNQTYLISYSSDLQTWSAPQSFATGQTGTFNATFTADGDETADFSNLFFRATR